MSDAEPPTPGAIKTVAACARISRAVAQLRSTKTIRERAQALLARARSGQSAWFSVNDGAMDNAAALVAELTRARYPDLKIPYHSRWRHFEVGGIDRAGQLKRKLQQATREASREEIARTQIDLALVAVLLDAGAGPDWSYCEAAVGQRPAQRFSRSEGLGVASFHAFMAGLFSSDPAQPLRADAQGLQAVTAERLKKAFQVMPKNPLVGLEGRAALLCRLGEALQAQPELFGHPARPGHLFDLLTKGQASIAAEDLLSVLLTSLAPIWPAQNAIENIAIGDCWKHAEAGSDCEADDPTKGWMPFHKLSQWLTYSLLEPFEWAGIRIEGLDALTGLPEYRNGGLFLDSGVLRLKNAKLANRVFEVGDELIVEWRALTVALLDELAPMVREQLGLTEIQMPLACVLEGGTWAAGRALAQQLRHGQPPLNIQSDGTVF